MIWRVDARRDFEELRRGERRRAGPLTVTLAAPDAARPPRVAYAIGRKVGTAPARNRLRRRLRALFAADADRLAPAAYLVAARPGAADVPFDQLRAYLTQALDALHALDG